MKTILIALPTDVNDMTAFLRSFGPFSLMKRFVEIKTPPNVTNWYLDFKYWVGIDCVFVHRPAGRGAQEIMEAAKMHRVPIWVDHDDDLLRIPDKNPFSQYYKNLHLDCTSTENSYTMADIITCQSPIMLKELREKYNRDDAILIPEAIHDRLLPMGKTHNTTPKTVAWRGSRTHESDVAIYSEAINSIMANLEFEGIHFFGIDPKKAGITVDKFLWYDQMPIFKFYKYLTTANAPFHFVCLEDNPFNRVKSHLAFLDATLAGSIVLGPNIGPYENLPCLKYEVNNQTSFAKEFASMLEMDLSDTASMHYRAKQLVLDCYIQSRTNRKRKEIIANL